MQPSGSNPTKGGVVIAPETSRVKYDIEIPWLIRGKSEHSQASERLETSASRIWLYDIRSMYLRQTDVPVDGDGSKVESGGGKTIHQGLPSDVIVSDIVEKIGQYTGVWDSNASVSRIVLEYLEQHCFGQPAVFKERSDSVDLLGTGLSDYIARYLSREFVQARYNPKCIKVALSSTIPFTWIHDIPLIKASKTIFNYVATLNQYERDFANFLDRCEDVLSFTSLGVRQQRSLVMRGQEGLPASSILSCDPDWVVVHRCNGEIWNWIIGTKHLTPKDDHSNEFMTAEWCEVATQLTGTFWQYILVDPRIGFEQFPSFQALIVDDALRAIAALRATQQTRMSIEEIIQMRDEGRP